MPRRYYKRRTVVVRPKKKWASNMKVHGVGSSAPTEILVENSTQTSSPTPVIVKAGNFKIQGDAIITPGTSSVPIVSLVIVVFYWPEGLTLDAQSAQTVVDQHPEWILAWKQIDTQPVIVTGTSVSNSFAVSSRLKRNLNSGDRVCIGYISDSNIVTVTIKYTAQYWTCAN